MLSTIKNLLFITTFFLSINNAYSNTQTNNTIIFTQPFSGVKEKNIPPMIAKRVNNLVHKNDYEQSQSVSAFDILKATSGGQQSILIPIFMGTYSQSTLVGECGLFVLGKAADNDYSILANSDYLGQDESCFGLAGKAVRLDANGDGLDDLIYPIYLSDPNYTQGGRPSRGVMVFILNQNLKNICYDPIRSKFLTDKFKNKDLKQLATSLTNALKTIKPQSCK